MGGVSRVRRDTMKEGGTEGVGGGGGARGWRGLRGVELSGASRVRRG